MGNETTVEDCIFTAGNMMSPQDFLQSDMKTMRTPSFFLMLLFIAVSVGACWGQDKGNAATPPPQDKAKASAQPAPREAQTTWLNSKFKVLDILPGDKLVVDFKGLKIAVRLAHLAPLAQNEKAREFLRQNLIGKDVVIIPEDAAGLGEDGFPRVYAFLKGKDKSDFVNEDFLKAGLCSFAKEKASGDYKQFLDKLEVASQEAKPAADYRSSGSFCSELNSKRYHTMACKWATQMDQQSRIMYESFDAAEKADKSPCSLCLYDRVKDVRASGGEDNQEKTDRIHGHIIGLKGDDLFYSPVSKAVAQARLDELVLFKSLKEARESGRKPDPGSLRIDNPVVPAPAVGECIGRALPFFRPCRRPATQPTGLCEACLNVRTK